MQIKTNRNFAGALRAPTPIPTRQRLRLVLVMKAVIIAAVLSALLGVEITLHIAPQLRIIGNVAVVWYVRCLFLNGRLVP